MAYLQAGFNTLADAVNTQNKCLTAMDGKINHLVQLATGASTEPDVGVVYQPEGASANTANKAPQNPWECLTTLGYPASSPEQVRK